MPTRHGPAAPPAAIPAARPDALPMLRALLPGAPPDAWWRQFPREAWERLWRETGLVCPDPYPETDRAPWVITGAGMRCLDGERVAPDATDAEGVRRPA